MVVSSTRRPIPCPQPTWQRPGIERHDVVDAGEEQHRYAQLERESDEPPEQRLAAAGVDLERGDDCESLKHEEGELKALRPAEGDAEEIFVNESGDRKGDERRADEMSAAAGAVEDIFVEELGGGPIPAAPELAGRAREGRVIKWIERDAAGEAPRRGGGVGAPHQGQIKGADFGDVFKDERAMRPDGREDDGAQRDCYESDGRSPDQQLGILQRSQAHLGGTALHHKPEAVDGELKEFGERGFMSPDGLGFEIISFDQDPDGEHRGDASAEGHFRNDDEWANGNDEPERDEDGKAEARGPAHRGVMEEQRGRLNRGDDEKAVGEDH